MPSTLMALEDALSPLNLTVRAQALPPTDQGMLLWDAFFPRENVDSVDLQDVSTLDYRPTADRREWNADGRLVPMLSPSRRKVSMVPIEARDRIDEKEMQRLAEGSRGNNEVLRELIGASLPARTDKLVDACYRRLEVDAMTAWTAGTITQRNPENATQTYVASFGFDVARLNTAGTAWNDGGVNAYDLLQAWIVAAEDKVGKIKGAMLRLATINAILADAPNLQNSVKMTRTELADRISQDSGEPFEFFINENSVDIFTDGGTAYTRTKIWPAQKIAAIPADGKIGRTAFAPVVRAGELSSQGPDAGIDQRGVTIYHEGYNLHKGLEINAQLNALTVPDEARIYVTDTGI